MRTYLKNQANEDGVISFADFVRNALYAPGIGYYQRDSLRVGRGPQTDFYTSTTLGPVFGRLVTAAAVKLLQPESPDEYTFVEIGAEPGQALLEKGNHPFADLRVFRLGQAIELPEKAIVFSNEWLDAQPFVRLRFSDRRWREVGVRVDDDELAETYLPEPEPVAQKLICELPTGAPEGYTVDLSLEAENRLRDLINANWQGIFLTFDYGKFWEELITLHPHGTARAYRNHEQQSNLLDHPGEQDLTCHLCWDRLKSVLREAGLSGIQLETQESFFIHWAEKELAEIVTHHPGQFDQSRNALREILHPNQLGRVFQVLYGIKQEVEDKCQVSGFSR